jgi:drug/metabolite transporter (DMT)-like permease
MGVKMKYKGYILLGITILIFSTLEVVTSTIKGIISPLQLTFIRFFIGGLILLPFAIVKKDKLYKKDWLFFMGLGVLNIFISMGALQLSIHMGKASTAAILISSNPIFVMFFSALILKEKATIDKLACIVLGMAGILLIIYKGNSGGDTALSLALGFLASLTFGLYTVLGKLKSEGVSSITMISISSVLGSLLYIPVLLYLKLPIFYIPQAAILKMAYLGIFCSGIAYITYMESLKLLTASKGSMVFFLKPVIASTLAIIFLGENLNIKTLIGMLLVLTGILINFVKINIKTRNSIEQ